MSAPTTEARTKDKRKADETKPKFTEFGVLYTNLIYAEGEHPKNLYEVIILVDINSDDLCDLSSRKLG
jgi:hypothetical protein